MNDADYDRCIAVLESVHKLHNWRHYATKEGVTRDPWNVWVTFRGQLGTFDGGELTALVIAAHKHHVRAAISPHGFGWMRLQLTPKSPEGHMFDRHPGLVRLAERVVAAGASGVASVEPGDADRHTDPTGDPNGR